MVLSSCAILGLLGINRCVWKKEARWLVRLLCLSDFLSVLNKKIAQGTRWYRPPEVLLKADLIHSSLDLWAVGCVMVEMITKSPLFKGIKMLWKKKKKVTANQ